MDLLGKGRYLARANDAGHHYCQAPKLGSARVATNFVAYRDFAVELQTIFNLWRRHKLQSAFAKTEIMQVRGRGTRSCLAEIQNHERHGCRLDGTRRSRLCWIASCLGNRTASFRKWPLCNYALCSGCVIMRSAAF